MDVEKTIQFILDHQARLEVARTETEATMNRAWNAIGALAEKQEKLDESLAVLVEAQIRNQELFAKSDARFAQLDERIQDLVRAIGDYIRTRDGKTN
jgi:chemotaxis regulatin CheY-phosphate phosphatase CheZ